MSAPTDNITSSDLGGLTNVCRERRMGKLTVRRVDADAGGVTVSSAALDKMAQKLHDADSFCIDLIPPAPTGIAKHLTAKDAQMMGLDADGWRMWEWVQHGCAW